MSGRLLGIARKAAPRGEMESLKAGRLSHMLGLEGDYRGVWKPDKANNRQVTMFTRADWEFGLALVGATADWTQRRCNLFVEAIDLPRDAVRIRVAAEAVLEITGECDPCKRMEAVAEGLFPALLPDWRGGRLMRVVCDGDIAVGDEVRIEN